MLRILSLWVIGALSALFLSSILSGFTISKVFEAFVFIALLGAVNALIRPFIIKVTLPITVLTLGIFTLFIDAVLIHLLAEILPGITIDSNTTAILIAIGLSAINTLFSTLFAIDDSDSFYRNLVKKRASEKVKNIDKPGVIFLEIDGLSLPALKSAVQNAYMPTIGKWLRKSHQVVGWECDLASSTPACQAGILHGDNSDIPAFRWFDKNKKKIVSMSKPKDAENVEKRLSASSPLLRQGVSINNMFSGGAAVWTLTSSKLLIKGSAKAQSSLYYFFVDPYNFTRSIALSVVDIVREIKDAVYQRRAGVIPRLNHRGGKYPLIRAITTIIMRDMAVYTIIGNAYAGVPVVYSTFVGYDEVAHHAGIERSEAMTTLRFLDKQFSMLSQALKNAPRKYHLVVLSDHGQSQGATFLQRYGYSLEDLVNKLTQKKLEVQTSKGDEGWDRFNTVLTQITNEGNQSINRLFKKALKPKTKGRAVSFGPKELETHKDKKDTITKGTVVLASGNLGLIYFAESDKRLKLEQIESQHPKLIPGLVEHEGIGFVVVNSQKGPVILGKKGKYFLKSDKVAGTNPLANYGDNAHKHIKRAFNFTNAPDIYVVSTYFEDTNEVAAFEELVGSHGGLGGNQTKPFLLYPRVLEENRLQNIIGTENLHKQIVKWADLTR